MAGQVEGLRPLVDLFPPVSGSVQSDQWNERLTSRIQELSQPNVQIGKTRASNVDLLVNGKKGILIARPEDFLTSHPNELSEEFKWRHMIVSQYVEEVEIVTWLDLLS